MVNQIKTLEATVDTVSKFVSHLIDESNNLIESFNQAYENYCKNANDPCDALFFVEQFNQLTEAKILMIWCDYDLYTKMSIITETALSDYNYACEVLING